MQQKRHPNTTDKPRIKQNMSKQLKRSPVKIFILLFISNELDKHENGKEITNAKLIMADKERLINCW